MTEFVDKVREIAMSFPGVTERLSHGAPSWFIGKSPQFANYTDHHHGVEWTATWAATPPGASEALVLSDPETYFVPPYFGHRGWVGMRLNGSTDWDEVAELLEDGWRSVAPARLIAQRDS
ncbi:MAG: MmcQ/YjbR family DNA-binding protein [Actinomycetota bacterium]|nr:MmcQ/YjbR family DNA-binding protein [Actinomycetota bacterium]